jgi:hypothetical protein
VAKKQNSSNNSTTTKGQAEEPVRNIAEISAETLAKEARNDMNDTFAFPQIEWGNKNALLIFDAESKKQPMKVGITKSGDPVQWETEPYFNALNILMNVNHPWFKVMEEGLYLHQTLEEIMEGTKNENCGYMSHNQLTAMVTSTMIRRDLDILPGIYRLKWNGMFFTAADMPYQPYDQAEANWVKHNREAVQLVLALENLRKSAQLGQNVRLFWSEKMQPRANQVALNYGDYLNGNFEAINERIQKGIAAAIAWRQLANNSNRVDKAREDGKELPKLSDSFRLVEGEIVPSELVGKTIQFVNNGTTSPAQWTVTQDTDDLQGRQISLDVINATLAQNKGMKIGVVGDEPVTPKRPASKRRKNASMKDMETVVE